MFIQNNRSVYTQFEQLSTELKAISEALDESTVAEFKQKLIEYLECYIELCDSLADILPESDGKNFYVDALSQLKSQIKT